MKNLTKEETLKLVNVTVTLSMVEAMETLEQTFKLMRVYEMFEEEKIDPIEDTLIECFKQLLVLLKEE